jgi:hypothetical protein
VAGGIDRADGVSAIQADDSVAGVGSITAMTNKVKTFHGFADWLMFGGDLLGHNDPDHYEKIIEFNKLVASCVIDHSARGITAVAVNQLVTERQTVDPADLATVSPYLRENIRRFGEWVLDTRPPEKATTRPDIALSATDVRR